MYETYIFIFVSYIQICRDIYFFRMELEDLYFMSIFYCLILVTKSEKN